MAYLSLISGKLGKCIRQCEEIIRTSPDEIRAHNILGLAHIRRGDFDSGIEQYKKVLEIGPEINIYSYKHCKSVYVVTRQK